MPDAAFAGCRVAFLTPAHHCPTTVTMPVRRQRALLAAARAADMVIVEDDYDGGLPLDGPRPTSLGELDEDGRVIHVGSLSKILAPGLRLGWIAAPRPVIEELRVLRRLMHRHPPMNNQRAAALFLSLGHYRTHTARIGRMLRERAALMDGLMDGLMDWHLPGCAWRRAPGATSYWVTGPPGLDGRRLAEAARSQGVLLEPGDVFFADPAEGRATLRLGFSAIRTDRIAPGLARLAGLIAAARPG
ncbi:PLP-dependent aminotransferase family protein [Roseomonas sp. NAR14]|uniref:PLP-dependent aminotransferase family protein n=1 Tax=Roseomonas acroporae TaxID=2937791 RepID=A0A9X1YAS4_9PROT|nr:PLP-dependent aminotransferase family protein [Roseomonas acroporae]